MSFNTVLTLRLYNHRNLRSVLKLAFLQFVQNNSLFKATVWTAQ